MRARSPRFRAARRRPPAGPGAGAGSWLHPRSAAGQVFLLQIVIVLLLVAAATVAQLVHAEHEGTRRAEAQSVAVARAFAQAPGVVRALQSPHPTALLQPHAEAARKKAGVDFLVAMDRHGIRITHPDPDAIGKRFHGTIGPSLHGRTTVERATGPVQRPGTETVQAVVPATDSHGRVVGLVSAGLTVQSVSGLVDQELPVIVGAGLAGLALATGGTLLVTRRLRRQTHGLGPAEMTRMYEHHDAVLHAVREGVVIVDETGRLVLANAEARRLLGLPPDAEGRHVGGLGLEEALAWLLASGRAVTDEVHLAEDRLLAVNTRLTAPYGGQQGLVATLRDTTELSAVSGRAQVARERLKLLYESGVRIGTSLDVTRTAEELAEVSVPRFADVVAVDLLAQVVRGEEPEPQTGWRMRRVALSGVREGLPVYRVGEAITFLPGTPQAGALRSGRAVLVPDLSRSDEWRAHDPERARLLLEHGLHTAVTVPLQARGVALGVAHFYRAGQSPAFDEDDLAFSEELATRAAVSVDNARRYTRERATAVTLQRSLLPRGLPEQYALEAAWRYLPAEAGVGGDWFDVIPLSGARVALVVGDVMGHGLHAAATMGRLRTAVHNFSALDLPVDELLAHLDELVVRIVSEETAGAGEDVREEVAGATCLYAIYDPVAGVCTVARAGHFGPAVAYPDGTVAFPDVPASPPLGLGGQPFETAGLRLPEGSRLVLFTDGLVERRDRDIDVGLERLREALRDAPGSDPEDTCRAAFDSLVPSHPADDVALLVARTRLLPPSRVAEWDVAHDPAAVAPARAECVAQLREWGMEELVDASELILSELITNAVRHGRPPVTVRLLRAGHLICEVSDGSSTSPHPRRASITDEGGRGLFLVARFAQRWGTRYTSRGKVIWAEQSLHGAASGTGARELSADALLDQFDDLGG